MSLINRLQEDHLRRVGQDPRYRGVIDTLKAAQADGVSPQEIYLTAYQATRDQYVKDGRRLDPENLRHDAYMAATVGSVEHPYELSGLPAGTDKTKHYLASAAIASRIDRTLDDLRIVPEGARKAIAVGVTTGLGFLKEVLDVFGTGFNREDLKADLEGAKAPFSAPAVG